MATGRRQAYKVLLRLRFATKKKKYRILTIKHENRWLTDIKDIFSYFVENFSTLFISSIPHLSWGFSDLLELYISVEENECLMAIPIEKEIKGTVWSLHPLKSPCPDRFPGAFFRSYWPIVNEQVCSLV